MNFRWRLAREKIAGLLAIVALSLQKEELTDADHVIAKAVYEEIQPIMEYNLKNDVATISSAWHIAQVFSVAFKFTVISTSAMSYRGNLYRS